jgi:hypothetical protein
VELWNLVVAIPGHPAGSTVTRETIEGAGYHLPPAPEPAPNPKRDLYELTPARFLGWQPRPSGRAPVELWNLVVAIPGHPAGSTVTRETIEGAGYHLPQAPEPAPNPKRDLYELTPAAVSMIVKWVEQHRGDVEGVARWMRDALRVGGIRECRQIVKLAIAKDLNDRLKGNPPDVSQIKRAGDYVRGLKGQAARAFAKDYASHLVYAKPPAPTHQAYHVDGTEANTIRRELAQIFEAAFPNPRGARTRRTHAANPPRRTLIYTGGRLRGTWYGRHRNGKLYQHKFGGGTKAIYGLPDGSIQIVPHKGRLWGMH